MADMQQKQNLTIDTASGTGDDIIRSEALEPLLQPVLELQSTIDSR